MKSLLKQLELSEEEIQKLLLELDLDANPHVAIERRKHVRHTYEQRITVVLDDEPSGPPSTITAHARNLGRQALGFLHAGVVTPETRCTIHLVCLDGQIEQVEGVSIRYREVRPHVYEAGIQFHQPIDIEDYIEAD